DNFTAEARRREKQSQNITSEDTEKERRTQRRISIFWAFLVPPTLRKKREVWGTRLFRSPDLPITGSPDLQRMATSAGLVASFFSSLRTLKNSDLATAMHTRTAPKVQTMVAPVGVSKTTAER